MTAIIDHCDVVRAWMNWGAEEYPDSLITTFTRMGEEYLSETLRISDQVLTSDPLPIVNGVADLPSDWLESDFVRIIGGDALSYKSRHDFYTKDTSTGAYENNGKFTTIGRQIFVDDSVASGTELEIFYFGAVPQLLDTGTWLSLKYLSLNLLATLIHAGMYYVEDDRAAGWKTVVDGKVSSLNAAYRMAQPSGSRVSAKTKRSFG